MKREACDNCCQQRNMWNRMSCISHHHRRNTTIHILLATVLLLGSPCSNAFSPAPIARIACRASGSSRAFSAAATSRARRGYCSSASPLFSPLSSAATADDFDSSSEESEDNEVDDMTTTTAEQVDQVFNAVDIDGSGSIDLEEFNRHLSPAGYSSEDIEESFAEIDSDSNGVISRAEFRKAILDAASDDYDDDCPKGYILNSVKQKYVRMGPIGRISQKVEMLAPFRRTYRLISNLFGVDTKNIAKLGPSFVLAYSIISNLNGAASFSVAWYISCKQVSFKEPSTCFFSQCLCCSVYFFVARPHALHPWNSLFLSDWIVATSPRTMEVSTQGLRHGVWTRSSTAAISSCSCCCHVEIVRGVSGNDTKQAEMLARCCRWMSIHDGTGHDGTGCLSWCEHCEFIDGCPNLGVSEPASERNRRFV